MLKKIVIAAFLFGATTGLHAATPAEEKAEALKEASALLEKYGGVGDPATLQKLDSYIERTWNKYTNFYGTNSPIASEFALLRARSASAAKRRKAVAANWRQAIELLPITTSGARRLNYYTQAANAATAVEDFRSAEQFYAAARAFAVVREGNVDRTRLYLRLQELKTTGSAMEWRRLNDSLLDLRKYSEAFVMWSIPRLDALLGEAEIRLTMQPDHDDDKRLMLGDLKAKILLVQKGMNGSVPPQQIERIRTLFYALEDHFDL